MTISGRRVQPLWRRDLPFENSIQGQGFIYQRKWFVSFVLRYLLVTTVSGVAVDLDSDRSIIGPNPYQVCKDLHHWFSFCKLVLPDLERGFFLPLCPYRYLLLAAFFWHNVITLCEQIRYISTSSIIRGKSLIFRTISCLHGFLLEW